MVWVLVCVGLLAIALPGCSGSGPPTDNASKTSATGRHRTDTELRLSQPRAVHRATLLADDRVLITGGCTQPGCEGFDAARRSEIFQPATSLFTPGPVMHSARASGTATLLPDGRVLLAGGYPGEGEPPTSSAEVFDPATGRFDLVGPLSSARADHSATLTENGQVLIAGGFGTDGIALAETELFDPTTNTFAPSSPLTQPRAAHVAVRAGARVVLVGGTATGPALASTDVLDRGTWSPGPTLEQARIKLAAIALHDHTIFVVGGAANTEGRQKFASTEILDLNHPVTTPGPSLHEGEYKLDGAVDVLPDGRVVIAGGSGIEVFEPRDATMTRLSNPALVRRSFVTATLVDGDTLLIVGGYDDQIVPSDQAVLAEIPPRRAR